MSLIRVGHLSVYSFDDEVDQMCVSFMYGCWCLMQLNAAYALKSRSVFFNHTYSRVHQKVAKCDRQWAGSTLGGLRAMSSMHGPRKNTVRHL